MVTINHESHGPAKESRWKSVSQAEDVVLRVQTEYEAGAYR